MRVLLITAFLILSYGCLHGEWFEEARVCICNQCYSGKNCSTLISNCTIQMNHQQCTLCREWWKKQKEKVIINLDFQLKYQEYPDQSGIGPLLIETIKEENNADTEGYQVVFGHGGTQLLHAFLYAFHQKAKRTLNVFSRIPYYQYYKVYSDLNPSNTRFNTSRNLNPNNVLEFVAIPNNPDGIIHDKPYYQTSPYVVYDMVYYWSHNSENVKKVSYPIMMFSLSKMTGHSSSRFGWALIKDKEIAKYMIDYIWYSCHGVAIEAQYRSYVVLKSIIDSKGEFFKFMRQLMLRRWDRLIEIFNRYGRGKFSILSPKGFVVAWIKCNNLQRNESCFDIFNKNRILVNPGDTYGADAHHIRFNMQGDESTFNILIDYLIDMLTK